MNIPLSRRYEPAAIIVCPTRGPVYQQSNTWCIGFLNNKDIVSLTLEKE